MLAHMGYGSRKEVKEIIRKGFVLVNGELERNDDAKVSEDDEITLFDSNIKYTDKVYFLLNKPKGYISHTIDNLYPCVTDIIDDYHKDLFPVGRLDLDTTGVLLITNDGALCHQMLSPKRNIDKEYLVTFEGVLTDSKIKALENGVVLDDGYHTLPSKVIKKSYNEALLTIHEGKFHQVKRMFLSVDLEVVELDRVRFGSFTCSNLKQGEYVKLTKEEMESTLA